MQQQAFGKLLKAGEYRSLYNLTSKEFRTFISYEQFVDVVSTIRDRVGHYELIVQNEFLGQPQYVWVDRKMKMACGVIYNKHDEIHSFYIKPFLQFEQFTWTKNKYTMPISDDWYVFWGGANEFVNYHYAYEQQRFAYDLVVVKDGETHNLSEPRNENYYAFGKQVVAPQAGTVVKVVDGYYDNVPGEMDDLHPAGNYVVIEHAHKEYSLIAHFKEQSIAVKEGQYVEQGQHLGECGNSGNSSEPHIHFQVMDDANVKKARSLRIRFEDGYEAVQGDTVSARSASVKVKEPLSEKVDRLDTAWTLTEVALFVPRVIYNFFKICNEICSRGTKV